MKRQILITLDIEEEDQLHFINSESILDWLEAVIEDEPVKESFEVNVAVEELPINSELFVGEQNEEWANDN